MSGSVPLSAGSLSTALFVASALPMLHKALRTKDLASYSAVNIVLANVGNLVYAVYVFSLPAGPVWALHSFNLLTSGAMLIWYVRYELTRRRPRSERVVASGDSPGAPQTPDESSEVTTSVSAMELPVPVDDLALITDQPDDLVKAIARQRGRQAAGTPGRLAVFDDRLAATARAAGAGEPLDLVLVTTGGAGSLLNLDRRERAEVRITAVESTIRDLTDQSTNAARILAAADVAEAALGHDLEVFVGLPDAPGWTAAAETVEASGRSALLTAGPDRLGLARQLSGLIELDCPFAVRLGADVEPWSLLVAIEALIEDGTTEDAAALLAGATAAPGWDGATLTRVRRRISRVGLDLTEPDAAR